jgi:hypothetical protein
MSRQGLSYGGNQIYCHPRLDNITQRTFGQAGVNELNAFMHGEEDNLRGGSSFTKLARCFDSRETRHGYIQHDQVRLKSLSFRNKVRPIADSTDNFKARLQKYGYTVDYRLMIIGKQYTRLIRDRPHFRSIRNVEFRLQHEMILA